MPHAVIRRAPRRTGARQLGRAPEAQPRVTEREFQQAVVAYAELRGWRWYHTHDSRLSPPGWPDLVLSRRNPDGSARTIIAELKTQRGQPTLDQLEWLELLQHTPGIECVLWRPSDWAAITRALA